MKGWPKHKYWQNYKKKSHIMLNKKKSKHLNALKIKRRRSQWPRPDFKKLFGCACRGWKTKVQPLTCFFGLFTNWPEKQGLVVLICFHSTTKTEKPVDFHCCNYNFKCFLKYSFSISWTIEMKNQLHHLFSILLTMMSLRKD